MINSLPAVSLLSDCGRDIPAVNELLIKGLAVLEVHLDVLQGGHGLDAPLARRGLCDLHDRRGDGGSLPQQEAQAERVQEVLVALLLGALVGAGKLDHPAAVVAQT